MELYLVDVSKMCKAEITGMIKSYNLRLTEDYLIRLKNEGYNKLYFDKQTDSLMFYTLNNDKKTYQIGNHIKNMMIDLVALGFEKHSLVGQSDTKQDNVETKLATSTTKLTDTQIYAEIDRISKKINLLGIKSLTEDDLNFYKEYSDYI